VEGKGGNVKENVKEEAESRPFPWLLWFEEATEEGVRMDV